MPTKQSKLLVSTIAILAFASPAMAYVGPGAGLSAIGSILAFLGVIALMILGFVWYPIKRMFLSKRNNAEVDEDETPDAP
jgi:hypothetical protein